MDAVGSTCRSSIIIPSCHVPGRRMHFFLHVHIEKKNMTDHRSKRSSAFGM
jgi:hypothetical protein